MGIIGRAIVRMFGGKPISENENQDLFSIRRNTLISAINLLRRNEPVEKEAKASISFIVHRYVATKMKISHINEAREPARAFSTCKELKILLDKQELLWKEALENSKNKRFPEAIRNLRDADNLLQLEKASEDSLNVFWELEKAA